MAGLYLHIPFCKQACHYCDFHFSTSRKNQGAMVTALAREMVLRRDELAQETIETIYFGGGTPSVLSTDEIRYLLDSVYKNFTVSQDPEITLEANPDDLSIDRIRELRQTRINRLSIGIQSFFDDDLKSMNRAHNASQAKESLAEAVRHFDNISIDLIYGMPGMSDQKWRQNIEIALSFDIPHISSYALTVEPRTALHKMVRAGQVASPSDEMAAAHFQILVETLSHNGFIHYELSNFGKPGYFSRNNSAYWLRKSYLGIGPSAHSYDGVSRSWNAASNSLYLKAISRDELPREMEILTATDRYNEAVMTGLRTMWGVSPDQIEADFGSQYAQHLLRESTKMIADGLLVIDNQALKTTAKGKFLADGLASDLFWIDS